MKRVLEAVRQFHDAFALPSSERPRLPGPERRQLRADLLAEEYREYCRAEDADDLVAIADALGDMAYIIAGTALEYGIPLAAVFEVIHGSNMAKLGPDGQPIRRADGKVLKPAGWQPPDIAAVLACGGAKDG